MASNLFMVAMTLLTVGIVLFTFGVGNDDTVARNSGILVVTVGIIGWLGALKLAQKELDEQRAERDAERKEQSEQIKAILESMERNTDRLIKEIKVNDGEKLDREERKGEQ